MGASAQGRQLAHANPNVPRLYFQSDGLISETSPQSDKVGGAESPGHDVFELQVLRNLHRLHR